jgi:hypothetical protein
MLALTLALAAASLTVIDAERAFAQMAQDKGQWTAFRAYAAPDAVMFTPQPVNAQEFLEDKKDPPKAIRWQPTHAWVSCDGTLAVDTGNWQSADGKTVGFFTTVWRRQTDGGWKWIYDGGDQLTTARPDVLQPIVLAASCKGRPILDPPPMQAWPVFDNYGARDQSQQAGWAVKPDGSRTFYVTQWDGKRFIAVHEDTIAAPTK